VVVQLQLGHCRFNHHTNSQQGPWWPRVLPSGVRTNARESPEFERELISERRARGGESPGTVPVLRKRDILGSNCELPSVSKPRVPQRRLPRGILNRDRVALAVVETNRCCRQGLEIEYSRGRTIHAISRLLLAAERLGFERAIKMPNDSPRQPPSPPRSPSPAMMRGSGQ
jgi:hypothetical protein